MATPFSVISSEYCRPNSIRLTFDTNKGIACINNEVIFRVKKPSFTLHSRRVLLDASGRSPILTLRKELFTMHGRWQVFKHGSTDSNDLLFEVQRPSLRKPHKKNIELDVFRAKNTKEQWDFKVNATGNMSCDICASESSTILARMTNNEGTFEVEIQPNVEYAFIVALLMIVDEINYSDTAGNGGAGNGGVGNLTCVICLVNN